MRLAIAESTLEHPEEEEEEDVSLWVIEQSMKRISRILWPILLLQFGF